MHVLTELDSVKMFVLIFKIKIKTPKRILQNLYVDNCYL